MKRVLLFVVDGCSARVLGPMIERGELPTLGRMADAGTLALDCVSIFPSITPAATATIVTGRYPEGHGIAGMSWLDPATNRVSYFGDDVWTIVKRGPRGFFEGFLTRLNDDLLKAPTLFETAERQGRTAACFNHLIFRGDVRHRVKLPWLLRLLPTMPSELVVYGPSMLCLGDFVADRRRTRGPVPEAHGGILRRFGMDDDGTADFLMSFDGASALADFNVAYFADYDFDSHEKGPETAADTLRHVDTLLGRVFDQWGGLDRVLEEACVVLTADHAQSNVGAERSAAIELDALLDEWTIGDVGAGWKPGDDLLVCPNMRAAEIYFQRPTGDLERAAHALLCDSRIDQVIWREQTDAGEWYRVATADRGHLRFRPAAEGRLRDVHGGRWTCEGDAATVDARADSGGELTFGTYPNAFERIAAGLGHDRSGHVWATARPGFEFEVAGQTPHLGGGSHGTLHVLDSLVPLLIAGAPEGVRIPESPRLVDVEPLCRIALGLEPVLAPGRTHVVTPG